MASMLYNKMGLIPKQKPIRVMIMGQPGVGKTALLVRFVTKRFIGDYDSNLEKMYMYQVTMDSETVNFEILDTAAYIQYKSCNMEMNMRWADVFILVYSITDKCSFDDCSRLKFLINYNKKKRRLSTKEHLSDVPVILVGNKIDQQYDRMVTYADGKKRSQELGCVAFHEISVREDVDQAYEVFKEAYTCWKSMSYKNPKLKRSSSDNGAEAFFNSASRFISWPLVFGESAGSSSSRSEDTPEFRARASTEGHVQWRK
ncbi:Small GTP-binding protein domain,P-loop containing nucleoside triphosphate hydrolase,Small GTPase [Cinara cedri]|uniref:small monomeric GTPase n=1 Tax=Cinara cedri TaxID=506608 RepID=A0A5E4M645_9HEMI|nr:Small GTP-binding protein domain,P-loop containing nucleoside triphosphate hydrolase,Small GTPase [Cinara cedri]